MTPAMFYITEDREAFTLCDFTKSNMIHNTMTIASVPDIFFSMHKYVHYQLPNTAKRYKSFALFGNF